VAWSWNARAASGGFHVLRGSEERQLPMSDDEENDR